MGVLWVTKGVLGVETWLHLMASELVFPHVGL